MADSTTDWQEAPVVIPVGVLLRAYGALGAAECHLRDGLGLTSDLRVADLCGAAFDAISGAVADAD